MGSLAQCWGSCSSISLQSYGISILIKRSLPVVLEHTQRQRHLHFIFFMVDIHTCWEIQTLPCQAIQNRLLMTKDSSSCNRSERKQLLQHITEHSRIRTLEMNSLNRIKFKEDNGFWLVMRILRSLNLSGLDHIKLYRKCCWAHIVSKIPMERNWQR